MACIFSITLSSGQMADVSGLLLVMLIVSREGCPVNTAALLAAAQHCC